MRSLKAVITGLVPDAEFGSGVEMSRLIAVETIFGCFLPRPLSAFLQETDGAVFSRGGVVWSLARIQSENIAFRSKPEFRKHLDCPLFFADDGYGDRFSFAFRSDEQAYKNDIFRWKRESGVSVWYANDLVDYVVKRLTETYNA